VHVTGQLLERCVLYFIVLYCLKAVYLEGSQLRILSWLTRLSFIRSPLESKKKGTPNVEVMSVRPSSIRA